jgi:hypothetical protein
VLIAASVPMVWLIVAVRRVSNHYVLCPADETLTDIFLMLLL